MKKLYFLLLILISFTGFSQSAGDIVLTEFMNDSDAVSDTVGEWLELYNTTGSDIDLNGWTLKDDGSDSHTFTTSIIVPAASYFVMGRGADSTVNGGVNLNHSYGDGVFTMANGADEIVLLSPSSVEIDRIVYGVGDFPDGGPGFSISLDPNQLAGDNNLAANWCLSTSVFGAGDSGTPGAVNDACSPVCEASLASATIDCDAVTASTDTYSVTLAFSGAGTTTFVVTSAAGAVSGDDPSTNVTGNIIVSGIPEGTDVTITMDDTATGGLCALTRNITSPVCEPTGTVDIELRGIMDFTVPSGGSTGKAHHLVVTADNVELSDYGLGSANNGGGTDNEEFSLPAGIVNSGDNILIVRDIDAIEAYFTVEGYALFDLVIVDTNGNAVDGNGNDAIELFKNGSVVETFGDITDSGAATWDYLDSWAYKTTLGAAWPTGWSYGGANCTDGSTTIFDSSCVYPFLASLSTDTSSLNLIGLYPNPVTKGNSFVNISSNSSESMDVVIFDTLGKQLKRQTVTNNKIDISNLRSGIYLLKIVQDNKQITRKIIIE
ncbi:MAG: hypothetical protein ACI9YE_001091 [Psychroserpens sp.]|jgi:hypothetical protein